ncbi:HsdM family class I SAM-dependent methyltransferase [Pseudomonas monteilii]
MAQTTMVKQTRQVDQPVMQSPTQAMASAKLMARALAATFPASHHLPLARAFGVRMIEAWWCGLTRLDIVPQDLRPLLVTFDVEKLPEAAAQLAESIGLIAAKVDAEFGAYEIGLIYTSMLPIEHRSDYGIFYTPPLLTARLLHQATDANIDWATCRVLDPACGGGAFLAPVARRIIEEQKKCSPKLLMRSIGNRLRGYEVDPFGAWLSQVTLDAVVLPVSRLAGFQLPNMITVCDSLRDDPSEDRFDLVIGNPPYGRAKLDAKVRERYKRSLYGHANLYGLFTDLALRYVKPGGLICYVTPTSFLAGVYFKNLRALLGELAPPLAIDFISARKGVFDDVLQETALTTYRCKGSKVLVSVAEVTPSSDGLKVEETGSVLLPKDPSLPWLLPRTANQRDLVEHLTRMPHRLVDWGYGVSTGPLVWNRFKDQLAYQPGSERLPLLWAEAITADGRFVFRANKKNHAPYFQLKSGNEWLVTRKPCVLLQRTTAKEQGRRLIAASLPAEFIEEHGGVVIENHVNMIRPVIDVPKVSAEVLGVFINSTAADRAFRCVSGSVAVSAYELESLPLPGPDELVELTRLVSIGAENALIEIECSRLFERNR